MDYKKLLADTVILQDVESSEIEPLITVPKDPAMGDYCLPCFKFAKEMKKSPMALAQEIVSRIGAYNFLEKAEAVGGYVNFTLNKKMVATRVVEQILTEGVSYGRSEEGAGKTVCIDFSSVNIAKPFHMGHLLNTSIGGALCRIFRSLGYKVIGINHLGDWGTQFGKLIVAYKKWGCREDVDKRGVKALFDIYVKYHKEAEEDPSLDDEARAWFKKIEDGNEEALSLFGYFKEVTMKEVDRIYKRLNVTFDSYAGESFYNDKMQPVLDELEEKGLLELSDGAKVVRFAGDKMPPCLLVRSDGATLYATRDLAAAVYHKKTYDFYKCLYVVAYQQNLHFRQLFKVLELMGCDWAKDCVHVAYGMVSLEDGSMSTRKGKVVYLEDVIARCIEKALAIISEKNPSLENKEEIAKTVGVGAVIFGALYNNKIKDITFSYDKVLNFEGETSCYVQYTCARANSVLEKGGHAKDTVPEAVLPQEFEVVKKLAEFPNVLQDALEKYEPCFIARYAVDLAQLYNKFYFDCTILGAEGAVRDFRLALTEATLITLKNALALLGIGVPEKM